jgi:hypothetical protein
MPTRHCGKPPIALAGENEVGGKFRRTWKDTQGLANGEPLLTGGGLPQKKGINHAGKSEQPRDEREVDEDAWNDH